MHADDLRAIEHFFPDGSVLLAAPIDDHMDKIDSLEAACVLNAVTKRQHEFSTGRFLAARAMRKLGVSTQPVKRGLLNSPIWPKGIVGSISHTDDLCMVVMATDDKSSGLGLDIENVDANVDSIADLVLRREEKETQEPYTCSCHAQMLRQYFSAKEAIYKSAFAFARRIIEFREVAVCFDQVRGKFAASAPEDRRLNALVTQGTGSFAIVGNHVVSGFHLPPGLS